MARFKYYRDVALPAVARGEEWHWTLRRKEQPDELIGAICLALGDVNRGFWLGTEWQHQGFMTEAVIAVTDYWFDLLGFPVLRVPKAAANLASRRISEKHGMRSGRYGRARLRLRQTPCTEIWEITAEEWRAVRARSDTSAKD